ncbi:glycosyltransferase family 4 protein [Epilithonimonas zeae]|uniref:Glycosyltransferase involved in cell wall bisynthesis n=1 Tax=Epilithonimonas zeae TaxID=1416779 RepID=A0A1N6J5E4_9FLAO|nr:glycosyltransferase family 4 protein [Epilithonimonas zeae]SIO39452.1 Glycosyltransferase involved in cell wall bisynthesis [Epilithonimonas zeae]
MIRVLHIMSTVMGGGVERRRLSLAKYFKNTNFEMKLVGTYKDGVIAEQIEENGVEIIEVGDFNGPFHWGKHKEVQKIIDDFKPHIIHGAVYEGVTMAAINGFIKRVPIVLLEETSDPQNRSSKANFLLRIFSFAADRFIAIAPNVADYLKKKAKVSAKKVITINNGVEIPRTVSDLEIMNLKNQYSIKDDDFVVGTVGRLFNDHKKITDIIEAVHLLRELDKLKLIIVGSGKDEELIMQKAIDLGIQDRVIFTGYQFDTAPFYKLMDVFCIASQREGFGLVAAEAMLHHLPVIATKVGGLQNVVVDGETGMLIEPHQPREIANSIQKLYNSSELLDLYATNGYNRAIENYTEERYVREVIALYMELLKKKKIHA